MKYVVIALGCILLAGCGAGKSISQTCVSTKIAEVGGCGRYVCGVKYTDGSYGSQEVYKAVVGNTVTYCY